MANERRRFDQIANPTAVLVIGAVMILFGLYLVMFNPPAMDSDSGLSGQALGVACIVGGCIFGFFGISTKLRNNRHR